MNTKLLVLSLALSCTFAGSAIAMTKAVAHTIGTRAAVNVFGRTAKSQDLIFMFYGSLGTLEKSGARFST